MTDWGVQKTEAENKQYWEERLVKLSQMVESGELSSTDAKMVYSELLTAHQLNLQKIAAIDAAF